MRDFFPEICVVNFSLVTTVRIQLMYRRLSDISNVWKCMNTDHSVQGQ